MQGSNKIVNSLIWKFLERFGTVGIQFVIQIFLARLLGPSDYGVIALITVFITISNVFVQTGFNTSLIQQSDVQIEDYSSVFWMSIIIASLCYAVLFVSSPVIASFYSMPILKEVLRILGLTLFFGAYNSIQIAKISREFKFRMLFFSSLIGMVISGFIGIIMAYNNFGVWSIVFQQLSSQIVTSLVLYFEVDWHLEFKFNILRIKKLFGFGSKLLVSSLIDVLYNNLYNLIIGKVYSASQLGYYNRADQFPNLIVSNVNGSIQSVILPALSEKQDSIDEVRAMVRKSMSLSSYIIFPLMIGMAACAEPLVLLILTEKWLACVPLLRLLCFSYMLWPIHTANLQAINALGRSDIFLKLEIIKKIIGIITLIVSIPFGVIVMVFMKIVTGVISTFINAYPNVKLLRYNILDQFKDIFSAFVISVIMGIIVFLFDNIISGFGISIIARCALDAFIGFVIYLILSVIVKNKSFDYLINIIKVRK